MIVFFSFEHEILVFCSRWQSAVSMYLMTWTKKNVMCENLPEVLVCQACAIDSPCACLPMSRIEKNIVENLKENSNESDILTKTRSRDFNLSIFRVPTVADGMVLF